MPTSAGGYLWRYCPSKSVFGQYRDFIKGSSGNWTDPGAPSIQAPCHIHAHNWGQMSPRANIYRKPQLCVLPVVPLVSALQHSTQSLCCFAVTPWVSVPSSVPPHGAAQWDLGVPQQTRGNECLWQQGPLCTACSCSCRGHGAMAGQGWCSQPWQPWGALLALTTALGGYKGLLLCTAGGTSASCHGDHAALPLPSPPWALCGHAEEQGCGVPAHASTAGAISAWCLDQESARDLPTHFLQACNFWWTWQSPGTRHRAPGTATRSPGWQPPDEPQQAEKEGNCPAWGTCSTLCFPTGCLFPVMGSQHGLWPRDSSINCVIAPAKRVQR